MTYPTVPRPALASFIKRAKDSLDWDEGSRLSEMIMVYDELSKLSPPSTEDPDWVWLVIFEESGGVGGTIIFEDEQDARSTAQNIKAIICERIAIAPKGTVLTLQRSTILGLDGQPQPAKLVHV